jgi:hypothetical protein
VDDLSTTPGAARSPAASLRVALATLAASGGALLLAANLLPFRTGLVQVLLSALGGGVLGLGLAGLVLLARLRPARPRLQTPPPPGAGSPPLFETAGPTPDASASVDASAPLTPVPLAGPGPSGPATFPVFSALAEPQGPLPRAADAVFQVLRLARSLAPRPAAGPLPAAIPPAPEVQAGAPRTARSDVHALAMLLRYGLTGEWGDAGSEYLEGAWQRLLEAGLAIDPERRPDGISAFLTAQLDTLGEVDPLALEGLLPCERCGRRAVEEGPGREHSRFDGVHPDGRGFGGITYVHLRQCLACLTESRRFEDRRH